MKKYVVIYYNIGGNIDMKRMKKNMIDVAEIMAIIAHAFGTMAANTRCVSIYHQPQMPESIKKLRKE